MSIISYFMDRSHMGAVRKIGGRVGNGVDRVEFHFDHESPEFMGDEGRCLLQGSVWSTLDVDELIVAAMQEPNPFAGALGASLVLYTTRRALVFSGQEARHRQRFVAPPGTQVIGLNFDGSKLTGVLLEMVNEEGSGSVESIEGQIGTVVDSVTLRLRNGRSFHYGTADSADKCVGPFLLEPDERIIIVEQGVRDQMLGASVVFYTSLGNIFAVFGLTSRRLRRCAAPPGQQICGLEWEDGALVGIRTCGLDGSLQKRALHKIESNTVVYCVGAQCGRVAAKST